MSYSSISQCAADTAFQARLTACAAQEGADSPEQAMFAELRWPVASKSDIEAAYEYALNAGNPSPGGDPTVIPDAMILAAVQSVLNVTPG